MLRMTHLCGVIVAGSFCRCSAWWPRLCCLAPTPGSGSVPDAAGPAYQASCYRRSRCMTTAWNIETVAPSYCQTCCCFSFPHSNTLLGMCPDFEKKGILVSTREGGS